MMDKNDPKFTCYLQDMDWKLSYQLSTFLHLTQLYFVLTEELNG